ncbi:MAG TPA: hypothetical protein VGL48_11025 [Acidimicrobiales bacterium]|jgi:hypothetical protein
MSPDDAEQGAESPLEVPADAAARLLRLFEEESVDGNVPFPMFVDAHRRAPNAPAAAGAAGGDPTAPGPDLDPMVDPATNPVWMNHPVLYLDDDEAGLS